MRFKLTLSIDKSAYGSRLPFNYQYEQSAVIYKILSQSDAAFAEWLHDNGFNADRKQFKLFVFSRLQIESFRVEKNRLNILSDTVDWHISFLPERSTREFVQGLFREQSFELGNREAKIKCRVQSIEMSPPPSFNETMKFKTLSPICIALNKEDGTIEYIAPDHPEAIRLLRQNLLDKYCSFYGKQLSIIDFPFSVKPLSKPKSALITVKAATPQETKVRGFMCDIAVTAPVELMSTLYESGLGSKNSLGFGMLEEIKAF